MPASQKLHPCPPFSVSTYTFFLIPVFQGIENWYYWYQGWHHEADPWGWILELDCFLIWRPRKPCRCWWRHGNSPWYAMTLWWCRCQKHVGCQVAATHDWLVWCSYNFKYITVAWLFLMAVKVWKRLTDEWQLIINLNADNESPRASVAALKEILIFLLV